MDRLLVALALVGCGGAAPAATETDVRSGIDEEFADLERGLLEAESLTLPFAIEASGAIAATLEGELQIEGPMIRLTAAGTFAGEPVDLQLRADESFLFIGEREQPRPAHLKEAIVFGLTRMGILHNLAVLTSGRAPDHADVGVEPWLAVRVRSSEPYVLDILVDGERVADARLTVSEGRLVSRRQTVTFPEGEMHVRETYGGG